MQRAVMGEVLDRYERAELLADWAEARQRLGAGAFVGDLVRTPAQRRADALYAIFVRAASPPADAASPVPLVNVVIDQRSFEEQVRRAAGEEMDLDPNDDLGGHRCHDLDGTPLHPADVLAAALVGHVRRVVVDHRGARLRDRGGDRRSTRQWRSVC
ncbi:MAG TPA: hypothetical protein DCS55_08630 [Acidimicrobiaceae bacterium]|nr:hypothetical protein [Acidimicrobiaceae bacterium]